MRRRFFVDEVRNGHAEIAGDDAKHLTRVLRVEAGQRFEISDNRSVFLAEIETARKERVIFRTLEPLDPPAPEARITLCAALIKFDRFEWMIEKATELGVARIIPVIAARSEHGLDRAAHKRVERWRRIALESSQQSRRAFLPEVDEPMKFRDACATGAASGSAIGAVYRYVLDEDCASENKDDREAKAPRDAPRDPPSLFDALPQNRCPNDEIALMIGPEGGWIPEERAAFSAPGDAGEDGSSVHHAAWTAVSMGPLILRAETAAVAALAVIRLAWLH